MYKRILYCVIFLGMNLFSLDYLSAQEQRGYVLRYDIENGDTLFTSTLRELTLRPYRTSRGQFGNNREWRQYFKLVYNFKKAYPYALLAKERLRVIEEELQRIPTEAERKKRIKEAEKQLFQEFEKPIRKLSISQGKLLLKLIDREIGQSSYYLIKDLKGGLYATFWQGVAKLFGSDLKRQYDKYGEDREVEELVQIYQEGRFDWFYYQIFSS